VNTFNKEFATAWFSGFLAMTILPTAYCRLPTDEYAYIGQAQGPAPTLLIFIAILQISQYFIIGIFLFLITIIRYLLLDKDL
jgi:hypothetical protein